LVKNYLSYIKESAKPKFFDIRLILNSYGSAAMAQKEIEQLVIGEVCVWYTSSGSSIIKKQVVSSVEVTNTREVLFNGWLVNPIYKVEIEEKQSKKYDVVGFPSGEVLSIDQDNLKKMIPLGIVTFARDMRWRNIDYKNIHYFRDIDYYKIMKILNPDYKKPVKSNIKEKDDYEIGDMIVGKGFAGNMAVESRIGKVVDKVDRGKVAYLISFMMKFNPHLMDVPASVGDRIKPEDRKNCWWLTSENIKGLYTGDIETQIHLSDLQAKKDRVAELQYKLDLDEHEIDDDYHIRQLFKNNPGIKDVVIDRGDEDVTRYKDNLTDEDVTRYTALMKKHFEEENDLK